MTTVRLYLEDIEGDWFGWIEGFPGAYSQGATPQEAAQRAPQALLRYAAWLQSHGEPVPSALAGQTSADLRPEIIEVHHAALTDTGYEINGFFEPDARPLDEEEIALYLRLLQYSRADLLKAAQAIPPQQWDSAPFGGKSVRAILTHLASAERFYLTCLHLPVALPSTSDPLEQLAVVRGELERLMSALSSEGRRMIVQHEEKWSARKTLRRALWHERYHTAQLTARSNPNEYLRALNPDRYPGG
jgi:predicted RNase H-like HicB family nuclease/uncharacterized damage-inducible protein DinB